MQHAIYPAGSLVADTQSLGGNATSDNFPKKFSPGKYTNLLTVNRNGEKLTVTIANPGKNDLWLRAADGNLLTWLEAKDGKTWRPIQWHYWITCGNSYHNVALQPGFQFTYHPLIPSGSLQTEVRLALLTSTDTEARKPIYSDPVKTTINPNLFKLDSEKHPTEEVTTEWITPTLRPKQ